MTSGEVAAPVVPRGPAVPRAFDIRQPIPLGVTLLEASAGTGKTHTIADLAARILAEGVPVERLLVVTFTRNATGELRHRVRARLVEAEAALGGPEADAAPAVRDLRAALSHPDPAEVVRRQGRLQAALADFDAATISTIHGFCEQVLTGLGLAADTGWDLDHATEDDRLIDEVVDDLYLRKYRAAGRPAFTREEARLIVAAAVAHPDVRIAPRVVDDSLASLRASLARRGREEVRRRARRAGIVSWDDQVARLAEALADPDGLATRRLRRRFGAVLVDEFQDTDVAQWQVFERAFAGAGIPLMLIGDPKQAIYSFRGADIRTYLDAARAAADRRTLTTNWRADEPLLHALDTLFTGATFGDPEIAYLPVRAAPGHGGDRLQGAPAGGQLQVRMLHRDDGLPVTGAGLIRTAEARAAVAADLAVHTVAILESGATVPAGEGRDALAPGHLAVLVRTNSDAVVVRDALRLARVPAVINGGGSVFAEAAATEWLTLLEALEQPAAPTRARAAARTPFIGWTTAELAGATDRQVEQLQASLHRWAAVLAERGVAALADVVTAEGGMLGRELGVEGGERRVTDLRHIAELLHVEALHAGAGTRTLSAWLRERMRDVADGPEEGDRTRRLESDADAVQILTVHRAKGLQFPVTFVPFLWHGWEGGDMPLYHDPEEAVRTLDVGGERDGYGLRRMLADQERRGEELRQAYVALTRARHRVVVWWASSHMVKDAPLARLVLGRGADGSVADRPARVPRHDDEVEAALLALAGRSNGTITVTRVRPGIDAALSARPRTTGDLATYPFARALDLEWGRVSYTGITSGHHAARGPAVASEAEGSQLRDEPAMPLVAVGEDGDAPSPDGALPSPMAALEAGAAFGIAVHAVCEATDWAADDLAGELARHVEAVARTAAPRRGGAADTTGLTEAMLAVADTPLGPLFEGRRLRDLTRADRLDELGFELPLAGGDRVADAGAGVAGEGGERARRGPDVAAIAACMAAHLGPGDPLRDYPTHLAALGERAMRGYLTGSIDLVARVKAGTGDRFVVVDYKTNWLAPPGAALTTWHYRPARMVEAMIAEHYPLQAALYSVALHRYLRWRLAGYEPTQHLGGVAYLFLRGMAGPATPVIDGHRCGVCTWKPPAAMVCDLSDVLAGAEA